jgi:hypothetical protein
VARNVFKSPFLNRNRHGTTAIRPKTLVFENMKSIHINSIHRLILMVPVIYLMAFAACSSIAGTARKHVTVNLQSAARGYPQAGDNVTIGPTSYNSETRGFDRPWPFGPESNPQ